MTYRNICATVAEHYQKGLGLSDKSCILNLLEKKIRVCVRTRKYPLIWIVILKCAQDTCDREINTNHK